MARRSKLKRQRLFWFRRMETLSRPGCEGVGGERRAAVSFRKGWWCPRRTWKRLSRVSQTHRPGAQARETGRNDAAVRCRLPRALPPAAPRASDHFLGLAPLQMQGSSHPQYQPINQPINPCSFTPFRAPFWCQGRAPESERLHSLLAAPVRGLQGRKRGAEGQRDPLGKESSSCCREADPQQKNRRIPGIDNVKREARAAGLPCTLLRPLSRRPQILQMSYDILGEAGL